MNISKRLMTSSFLTLMILFSITVKAQEEPCPTPTPTPRDGGDTPILNRCGDTPILNRTSSNGSSSVQSNAIPLTVFAREAFYKLVSLLPY